MSAPVLAAIDVGGTKVGWALGTATGEVVASDRRATDPAARPADLLEDALNGLRGLASEHGPPAALGVACPGPFLQPEGRFLAVPNLPAWQGFALTEFLRARFEGPVQAMNDANAGALAEWRWGAARGADTAVFLTMSTGMGAGLVLNGRLFEGARGFAGEVGHLRLAPDGPVGFGKRGSVEGYLSGPGIVQVARGEVLRATQRGEPTELPGTATLTPEAVCEAARRGDGAAAATVALVGDRLGQLCALLVDLLNPDVIVLGTIASAYPELFLERAREGIAAEAIDHAARHVELTTSGLADRGNQGALAVAAWAADGGSVPP